jgi:hypothetical protein
MSEVWCEEAVGLPQPSALCYVSVSGAYNMLDRH